jgi:hypothetical protein
MGALMDFARSKHGLLLFIIIPGALLIITESHKLYGNLVRMNREKKKLQA